MQALTESHGQPRLVCPSHNNFGIASISSSIKTKEEQLIHEYTATSREDKALKATQEILAPASRKLPGWAMQNWSKRNKELRAGSTWPKGKSAKDFCWPQVRHATKLPTCHEIRFVASGIDRVVGQVIWILKSG